MRLKNVLTIMLALSACNSEARVPAGRIRVKNDSMDSSYNVVRVSANGRSYSLKPTESVLLPSGATIIRFSRQYADHVKSYTVHCPSKLDSGIMIKLIDVHLNRMPGGCKTVEANH